MRKHIFFTVLFTGWLVSTSQAAVWKTTGEIRFVRFYAEMNDQADPVVVMLRVENNSDIESLKVSRDFVQMTDSRNQRMRPILADEVVSGYLEKLRELLPQHAAEIDHILGEIQADFPQQKIVEVYARLKKYMKEGRPITWRTGLENFLLGKRESTSEDVKEAEKIIEQIGLLSKNYFWPTEIAPGAQYTGIAFFKKPDYQPVNLFFEINKEFLGRPMEIVAGDGNLPAIPQNK